MRKLILAAVIAGLIAPHGSSGTTLFSSADIHRPLVPQSIPEPDAYLQLFPEGSKDALLKTRKFVRRAWNYFKVTEVNDGSDWLSISELLEAHRLTPGDPYAPCLLGSYLALHHKLAAAAEATRESLRLLQAIEERSAPSASGDPAGFLGDLHVRCGINLARYRLLLGDAEGALDALSELPSLDRAQGPVAQRAYWWLATLALAELGEVSVASLALDEAKKIETPASEPDEATAYPQYFWRAGAVEKYLDAVLLWKEGRREEATATMRAAVDAWARFGVQSKFYDARTSLAIFLADTERASEAVEMLEKLRKAPIQGKMLRSETITYNLALILSNRGELDRAEALYRDAIGQTVERNCDYFKTMAASVDGARGCSNLAEVCEGFQEQSYRCDLRKCSSYRKASQPFASPTWFCDSLQGDRFVAAHNNLGDVYLRQAGRAGSGAGKRFEQALYQFRFALAGTEPDSETWHGINLNIARAQLARSDWEGFLAALSAGLSRKSAPVLTYISLLETPGRSISPVSAARLYLDMVEDAWGQDPPGEVRSQLEALASALEARGGPAEDQLLSLRARRLLKPDAPLPVPALAPLAEGTERLRNALIHGDEEAGKAAVSQVQEACPGLLEDASSCVDASRETSRDAMFLNGLWHLEQGNEERALAYFEAAGRVDPSWPLSRRYIEQLQASR